MIDRWTLLVRYAQAMSGVLARMNQATWDATRTVTLGGAGLSAALIFVVVQIHVGTTALKITLFCASLGIPVWLALWRFGEAYAFYGRKSYGHFIAPRASGVGILLFFFGIALLLVAFVTLIGHFSVFSAIVFFIANIVMAVFTYKHQISVRAWVDKVGSNDG